MKNKKLRAHSMREIWALGATASEYRRVTREFPEDWVKEFQLPADPGASICKIKGESKNEAHIV